MLFRSVNHKSRNNYKQSKLSDSDIISLRTYTSLMWSSTEKL